MSHEGREILGYQVEKFWYAIEWKIMAQWIRRIILFFSL
jgi:hypothetical protein